MGYFQVRYDSRVVYYDCRAFENLTRERKREDDKNEQKSSAKIALTFCCFNAPTYVSILSKNVASLSVILSYCMAVVLSLYKVIGQEGNPYQVTAASTSSNTIPVANLIKPLRS